MRGECLISQAAMRESWRSARQAAQQARATRTLARTTRARSVRLRAEAVVVITATSATRIKVT